MNDQEKHELNVRVHTEIFGKEVYTQEQMKEWAEEVWKTQPFCIYFSQGFSLKSGRFYGSRENPQIDANSPPVFEQPVGNYSGELYSAWSVFEHFAAMGWGHSHTQYDESSVIVAENNFYVAFFKDPENVTINAETIELAICKAGLELAAYMKNLEIEKQANEIINAALDEYVREQITAESSLLKATTNDFDATMKKNLLPAVERFRL